MMAWATDEEIKALAQQIGIGSGTLPSGWDTAATAANDEAKGMIAARIAARGYNDIAAVAAQAVNLHSFHLHLAVYLLLADIVALDQDAAPDLERIDRRGELDSFIPVDSDGNLVGISETHKTHEIPYSTTADRERQFGAPDDILW